MKDFIKREMLVKMIVGSLTVAVLIVALSKINSDNKAIEQMNKEIKSIHQEIKTQNKSTDEINKRLNDVEMKIDKVDNLEKHLNDVDKAVKEKLSYREKMSMAIQQTSDYVNKNKADELATIIDDVTTEFKNKYGYPKDNARVMAIMSAESDFRNLGSNDAGAIGYTQITPPCLQEVNKITGWGYSMDDMFDARKNIEVAWYYINKDKLKYGDDKSIVAYNQGYRNLDRAVTVSRGSSRSYLSKVTNRTLKYREMIGGSK